MFVKNFKLKPKNAKKIKEVIKKGEEVDLKILSFKSNGKILHYDDIIIVSFIDDRVLGIAIDDEVLGKSIDYDRFSQSLVSRLIATSHRLIPASDTEEDFEPAREELDCRPASSQENSQEDRSSDDHSRSEEDKSLEESLLEEAERNPEVSQSSDALPSEDARELLEDEMQEDRGEAGDEAGSSQPNQTSGENLLEACTSSKPVATGEVSTRENEADDKKGQVQDCSFTKKELEKVKEEVKVLKAKLSTQNLSYYGTAGQEKIIRESKDKLKEIKNKLKNKTANSKTVKKLLQKIEKNIQKIEKEILPEAEKLLKKAEENSKIPMREFNLPYCYTPDDNLLEIQQNYRKYITSKQYKKIKNLFKKLLDEIGFEETPRIDKKKLVVNLAKYKNPYNSYKQEAEKSYLLLLVDLSGSMASFEELKYPAYAISKEHENVITILNSNAVPFAVIKDGKVAQIDISWNNNDQTVNFYKELIKNYNISQIISISDWDGVEIYEMLMENTNAKWIWCDPYCCNVCNYEPQKENSGRYLPDNIKKFKNKISYWYAVGDIDGFVKVLEEETF